MTSLSGKVAVITGGTRGIGLATAQRFVKEGAQVVIAGRRRAALENALAMLGDGATGLQLDVSNLSDLDRLYEHVRQVAGHIDILVCSAGVCAIVPLAQSDEADFDRQFDINAKGLFFTVQKALPLLRDGASIVLVSSIAHFKGLVGYHIYGGSKAAVRAFARNWAVELKDRKIRVNVVSPGPTVTPMANELGVSPEELADFIEQIPVLVPLGRQGRPEEQASAILFLASDESSFITGADICTDGGMGQI